MAKRSANGPGRWPGVVVAACLVVWAIFIGGMIVETWRRDACENEARRKQISVGGIWLSARVDGKCYVRPALHSINGLKWIEVKP